MSSDLDDVSTLLGAAGRASDPALCLLYMARARVLYDAEGERLHHLGLLLDAREAELTRTAPPVQATLVTKGVK